MADAKIIQFPKQELSGSTRTDAKILQLPTPEYSRNAGEADPFSKLGKFWRETLTGRGRKVLAALGIAGVLGSGIAVASQVRIESTVAHMEGTTAPIAPGQTVDGISVQLLDRVADAAAANGEPEALVQRDLLGVNLNSNIEEITEDTAVGGSVNVSKSNVAAGTLVRSPDVDAVKIWAPVQLPGLSPEDQYGLRINHSQ